MKVIFAPEFSLELDYYFEYFKKQGEYQGQPDLGIEFVRDVYNALERVEAHPKAWKTTSHDLRRIHLKKFKNHSIRYSYDTSERTLRLVRLTHSSRNL